MFSRIQYISQGNSRTEQSRNIHTALDAGCDWIQLRYKDKEDVLRDAFTENIKALCDKYGAQLIINDYADLASQIDADGVHLGLMDMSVQEARKIVGEHKIIGGTANTLEDVLMRIKQQCDYIGLGPFRHTATKEALSPVLGSTGYSAIIEELNKLKLEHRIYAIGGIGMNDLPALMNTGIHGIAVSGLITHANHKKDIVSQLKDLVYGEVENC